MRALLLRAGQFWRKLTDVRRFDAGTRSAKVAQEHKLLEILQASQDSVYGREHGFRQIRDVAGFQSQVPVNDYAKLEPYVQRAMRGERGVLTRDDPLMFAVTSGTTGKAKFIPVTAGYLTEYTHAIQVHTWHMLRDHPDAGLGKFLVSSSCDVDGYTEGKKPYGAISGFLTQRQPWFVKKYFALPYEVALIKDVEAKYYLTLLLAIQQDVRLAVSVSPSSLVLLAEKMQLRAERLVEDVRRGRVWDGVTVPEAAARMVRERVRPNPERARALARILDRDGALTPHAVWPNLRMLSCWKGGTMPLYLQRVKRLWGDHPVRDFGYMASEGRGSIPLVNAGAAGVLAVTTHFFEFVPVDEIESAHPTCLTVDQLLPNREYYVLLTTSAGLYRYHINDIVRVVDYYRDTPLIQFIRKGQGISSVTGEKLTESQMTACLVDTVGSLCVDLQHFTAAPRWGEPPYYALMAELPGSVTAEVKRAFLQALDRALCEANVEYQGKRESQRLGAPVLQVLAPGTFDRYRQERVSQGAPEAQVKIPHLSPSLDFGKKFPVVEEVRLEGDARGPAA